MAKNGGKDNIDNGDAHGQNSFEGVGVLLPKISKEQYDEELDSFERIPKSFDEIDKEEIASMGYQVFNSAIKNGKEQAALGVVKLFSEITGLAIKAKPKEEEKPQRKVIFEVIDANHKKPANPPTA